MAPAVLVVNLLVAISVVTGVVCVWGHSPVSIGVLLILACKRAVVYVICSTAAVFKKETLDIAVG